jgi:hypothetical protein
MEGTGAVAMPRRAKNIDMKNPPWNKKMYVCEPLMIFIKKTLSTSKEFTHIPSGVVDTGGK